MLHGSPWFQVLKDVNIGIDTYIIDTYIVGKIQTISDSKIKKHNTGAHNPQKQRIHVQNTSEFLIIKL